MEWAAVRSAPKWRANASTLGRLALPPTTNSAISSARSSNRNLLTTSCVQARGLAHGVVVRARRGAGARLEARSQRNGGGGSVAFDWARRCGHGRLRRPVDLSGRWHEVGWPNAHNMPRAVAADGPALRGGYPLEQRHVHPVQSRRGGEAGYACSVSSSQRGRLGRCRSVLGAHVYRARRTFARERRHVSSAATRHGSARIRQGVSSTSLWPACARACGC